MNAFSATSTLYGIAPTLAIRITVMPNRFRTLSIVEPEAEFFQVALQVL